MVELIERKKRGEELAPEELRRIVSGYVAGDIPDYQVGAWLMAVCLRGMSDGETLALTRAIIESGETLEWDDLPRPPVDKHSTGGVGDKTTLVLIPLMAAAGLPFVKMSGRGLGHTGGTLDKLESIPGFSVDLDLPALREQVRRIGCAIVGQSRRLVPADGKLYALRDVTATVNAVPLIASSIMSKKLAAGAQAIVLDVKYGSGAFMESEEEARELARTMVAIGQGAGRKVRAVLSSMEEPLGIAVGNALEVREAIETLHGRGPDDLWALTVQLGAHILELAGVAASREEAQRTIERLRADGSAREKLRELVHSQGGDAGVVDDTGLLPAAPVVRPLPLEAEAPKWVARVDARAVADAALSLGAGRRRKDDVLDLSVGVLVLAKGGTRVEPGEPLAEIHAGSEAAADAAAGLLREAFSLSEERVERAPQSYEAVLG